MARSSKKSRSAFASLASTVAALAPSGSSLKTVAIGACWLGALGGIAYATYRGYPRLRAYAEARVAVDPAGVAISFSSPPAWMPQETLGEIVGHLRSAMATASPLEGEALQRVHQELLASGWFARVEQVRRVSTSEIFVTAEFRTPFALVRWGDEDHLIDSQGRRLPVSYVGASERPRLPLIVGVAMPKPAEVGAIWLGSDMRAAINLTSLLRDRVWFANGQIRSIDTSRFAGESIVELVTDRDTRIVWGSDPLSRTLGEATPESKLDNLDALYRVSKRVDGNRGGTLDLRYDVVTLAPTPSSVSAEDESGSVPESLTASAP